jgi:hypothetical protein
MRCRLDVDARESKFKRRTHEIDIKDYDKPPPPLLWCVTISEYLLFVVLVLFLFILAIS